MNKKSISFTRKVNHLQTKYGKYYLQMQETFGEFVSRNRRAIGISQSELARQIGKTSNYIHYIERDYNPSSKDGKLNVSVDVVDKLAKGLGVPLDEARLAAGYAPLPNLSEMTQADEVKFRMNEISQSVLAFANESDTPEGEAIDLANTLKAVSESLVAERRKRLTKKEKAVQK